MEEESEKNLLPQQESVEVEAEQKEESANNETTLLPETEAEKLEEKQPTPRTKFFKLFERKKISSSENLEVPAKEKDLEAKPSRTRPNFSGFLNKFRRGKYDVTDGGVELCNMKSGPKAGLASMETLDDSTKDPWGTENGSPDIKVPKDEENGVKGDEEEGEKEKPMPLWQACWQNTINYQWSIDDIALIAGILIFLILVSLIILFTFTGTTKKSTSAPIRGGKVLAVTSCGYVEGIVEENAGIAFRGIPYARPPIGKLRFEPAQPIENLDDCWNGTLQAYNVSNVCMQVTDKNETIGTEDCLHLDVITPEVRYINLLPVIVLLGSNNFVNGSPGLLRPSTRYSRSKSVVFVRPNFRMGVLGYLALESISNSSNVPTSGNYALSDIIMALEWIQLNIVNFGGDPNSITILGHRTGATLATALTAIPRANKLFKQVWASSGSFHFPGESLENSERNNLGYAGFYPECKEKSCWKSKEASELISKVPKEWSVEHVTSLPAYNENSSEFHDWIVLDGVNLKEHVQDFWKSSTKGMPKIVIGTTAHAAFDPSKNSFLSQNLTEEEIESYVNDSKIGNLNLTEEAFKRYGKTKEGLISMISDIRVICPLFVLARSQSNIAFYVVTQTQAHGNLSLADVDSDIQAILGRYTSDTPEKRRYLETMRQLFYYFVYHGKVNYFNQQKPVLDIGQDVTQKIEYVNCDFWITNQVVPHYAAYY